LFLLQQGCQVLLLLLLLPHLLVLLQTSCAACALGALCLPLLLLPHSLLLDPCLTAQQLCALLAECPGSVRMRLAAA
jgi:hypothetical protein